MLDNLNVASFKGVRFPCNDTSTSVGRALIRHEFANSNSDNIEDQGLIPRTYTLVAIITGDNYQVERDNLLSAIESEGAGVLIHPFYGRIEGAVAAPVTYDESVKFLGRLEIPITFYISGNSGLPSPTELSTGRIASLRNEMMSSVQSDLASKFKVSEKYMGNFSAAKSKAESFVETIKSIANTTTSSESKSASYNSKIDSFERNVNSLVNDPVEMAANVVGLISDISGLYDTPSQVLDVSSKLFDFGDSDSIINPTTSGLVERSSNQQVFNESVKAASLAVAYEASVFESYRTVSEVDKVARSLEITYRSLKG